MQPSSRLMALLPGINPCRLSINPFPFELTRRQKEQNLHLNIKIRQKRL